MEVTIKQVEMEVWSQPEALRVAVGDAELPRLPDDSLLVGAGDSYAAAVAASQISSLRVLASDPLALLDMTGLGERDVCIISVSGRTRTNLKVAEMARMTGRSVTAVTAFRDSPLAALADEVVELPFKPAPRSPGMLSFTLSLLALLKITLPDFACDFRAAFDSAVDASRSFRVSKSEVTFLLGNWALYGVSIYGAAKVYEILGRKAQAEQVEQFGHMELFSLSRGDSVNILSGLGLCKSERQLHSELLKHRYSSGVIQAAGNTGVEKLFASIFAVQLGILREAETMRLKKPSFLRSPSALSTSDAVIY